MISVLSSAMLAFNQSRLICVLIARVTLVHWYLQCRAKQNLKLIQRCTSD
ncbi:MAG: hypothetical protein RL564_536 [Pseudomonadota bacterium]|jgi:hypothetical protein